MKSGKNGNCKKKVKKKPSKKKRSKKIKIEKPYPTRDRLKQTEGQ
jgi:hypothetical protein